MPSEPVDSTSTAPAVPGMPPVMPSEESDLDHVERFFGFLHGRLATCARKLSLLPARTMDQAIAAYMGCELTRLRRYEVNLPDGDGLLHAAQAMIRDAPTGWIIHPRRVNQYDDRTDLAVTYSEVEIGPEETAYCFSAGHLFIETPDGRLAIHIGERDYSGRRTLGLYLPDGSDDRVREILRQFHRMRIHESRYKGKRISVGEDSVTFLAPDAVDWGDLVLEDHVIEEIRRNVFLLLEDPDRWAASGLPLRRSILLSGIPGTGKTMIGKLIASKIKETFIWVTADGMGRSADIRKIYQIARDNRPTILFLEDIDIVASRNGNTSQVFGEILAQTDGLEPNDLVITIATTNHPEELDEALKDRPGRFDRHIEIRAPDDALRKRLFQHFMRQCHLRCSGSDLDALVERSAGLTGAHIRELVMTAGVDSLAEGWDPQVLPTLDRDFDHFVRAATRLKKVRPEIGFRTGEPDRIEAAPGNGR